MIEQNDQLDMFLKPPPPRLKGIFVPGNIASSKNRQVAVQIPLRGARKCPACKKMHPSRGMIVPAKQVKDYKTATEPIYARLAPDFRQLIVEMTPPYRIAFQFIRGNHHDFDYINMAQIVQDLMVKHGWTPEDNANVILPVFVPYRYDKDRPGIIIAPIPD